MNFLGEKGGRVILETKCDVQTKFVTNLSQVVAPAESANTMASRFRPKMPVIEPTIGQRQISPEDQPSTGSKGRCVRLREVFWFRQGSSDSNCVGNLREG